MISIVHIIRSFFHPAGALFALLCSAAVSSAETADTADYPQQRDEQDAALRAAREGDILPYPELKKRVERQLAGEIVGQRLMRTNTGWTYEVRVRRKDGRVVYALVDAANGKVMSRK